LFILHIDIQYNNFWIKANYNER